MDTKGINSDGIDLGKHEERDPRTLIPHPRNAELYGDEVNQALLADISVRGILVPLSITPTGLIVSGHARQICANILNIPLVPVIVLDLTDPDEIIAAMISANNTRQKTNYMRAREYQRLKPIEEARAKQRMLAGKTLDPMASLPQGLKIRKRIQEHFMYLSSEICRSKTDEISSPKKYITCPCVRCVILIFITILIVGLFNSLSSPPAL